MAVLRTKGLSTKVTDDEYAMFERLADGETLSEWIRDVLLQAASAQRAESVILAEVLALRTLVTNLLFRISTGQPVSADDMRRLIDLADADKVQQAHERLMPAAEGARHA